MAPELVGLIGLVILFALILLRIPIAFCFGLVGFAGCVYFVGFEGASTTLALYNWSQTTHYTLICLPMFVLMGQFIHVSGMGRDLYELFYRWVGKFKGGLALGTIGACAGFAACSGSSIAGVLTIGTIAYPEMKRFNYDRKLALGTISAAGTLAVLIPPSAIFIIYATLTEISVGKLFIAGIFPGILLAALLMAMIYIRCTLNPSLGPTGPSFTWREKLSTLPTGGVVMLLFLLVMGGIYLGWFTATEGSAVGAFAAFLIVLVRRKLGWHNFYESLMATGKTTCLVFLIVISATFYGHFIGLSRIPFLIAETVTSLPLPNEVLVAMILAIYIPLGAIMEVLAMLVLTLPIFFPVVVALGVDPILFGILVTMLCELAQITPPVGLAVYVIKSIAPDASIEEVFTGIFPFCLTIVVAIAIVFLFPQIAQFLPSLATS